MTGFVYMLSSQKRSPIYIGVTRLVWYEEHFDIRDAIQREKSLKRWPRQWKIVLIETTNPEWNELLRDGAGDAVLVRHGSSGQARG